METFLSAFYCILSVLETCRLRKVDPFEYTEGSYGYKSR